jgi:replicative DNA helicase
VTRAAPTCSAPQSFAADCIDGPMFLPMPFPQQDLDGEAVILSALLSDGDPDIAWPLDEVWLALGPLGPEHCYSESNRRIFEAIVELSFAGLSHDPVSVAGRLRDRGRLKQVGGVTYLMQLVGEVPAAGPTRLAALSARVIELAERRGLVARCSRGLAMLRCGEPAARVAAALNEGSE